MITTFNDLTIIHHHDAVEISQTAQTMGDHQNGFVCRYRIQQR